MIVLRPNRRRNHESAGPTTYTSPPGKTKPGGWLRFLLCLGVLSLAVGMLGGAFLAGVVAQREGHTRRWRKKVAPQAIPNYLRSLISDVALPTIHIDMKYKHLRLIEQKRQEALGRGILLTSDGDFVPAELRLDDRTLKVKMRLKGDWVDHLETEKWSYRIHVKQGEHLFGMRRFSIQHPFTRSYLAEWAFLENARMEGVVAPRYRFVKVVFNSTPKGIYALEEHFAKEMLESNGRRESAILKFNENPTWINAARVGSTISDEKRSALAPEHFRLAAVSAFAESHLAADEVLARMRDAGLSLLREFVEGGCRASDAFDVRLLARYLALTDLWNADHALSWQNLRFYYNPITCKLEPIAFDAHARTENLMLAMENPEPFLRAVLEDADIAQAYVRALDRMSSPEYLRSVREKMEDPLQEYLVGLHREWPALASPLDPLAKKQRYIRGAMNPASLVVAYVRRPSAPEKREEAPDLILEVANLLTLPVEINGYRIDDSPLMSLVPVTGKSKPLQTGSSHVILPPADVNGTPGFVRFAIPKGEFHAVSGEDLSPSVSVSVRLIGRNDWHQSAARLVLGGPRRLSYPSVAQALERHPFLVSGGTESSLRVREGRWDVLEDLVIPRRFALEMTAGTTIRFGAGAALVVSGPIVATGTEDRPIVLEPIGKDWPGIFVDRAKGRSLLEHVVVRKTRGIDRQGWSLTGGCTFYESSVTLRRCRLEDSTAEDLINVIRADFHFLDSEFGPCASDAFDGDFVTGRIERCSFRDTGDDAIDLSGSQTSLEDIALLRIADKGISAGEQSRVTARNIRARHVGIGVVSKDLSEVRINGMEICDARLGLAAYRKKSAYGFGAIVAREVTFLRTDQETLIQEGSRVKLDGRQLPGQPLDIDSLYEQGILGD